MTVPPELRWRQPARNPQQAKRRFLGHLQRSISCLSSHAVWVVGPTTDGPPLLNAYTRPDVVPLATSADRGPCYLRAGILFGFTDDLRHPGEHKVSAKGYTFTIAETADAGAELISWHWHPSSRPDTHLHVGHGHDTHGELARHHVPTGRVFFEQVIRFAIDELQVRPARPDWEAVLADTYGRVRRFATWHGNAPPA